MTQLSQRPQPWWASMHTRSPTCELVDALAERDDRAGPLVPGRELAERRRHREVAVEDLQVGAARAAHRRRAPAPRHSPARGPAARRCGCHPARTAPRRASSRGSVGRSVASTVAGHGSNRSSRWVQGSVRCGGGLAEQGELHRPPSANDRIVDASVELADLDLGPQARAQRVDEGRWLATGSWRRPAGRARPRTSRASGSAPRRARPRRSAARPSGRRRGAARRRSCARSCCRGCGDASGGRAARPGCSSGGAEAEVLQPAGHAPPAACRGGPPPRAARGAPARRCRRGRARRAARGW